MVFRGGRRTSGLHRAVLKALTLGLGLVGSIGLTAAASASESARLSVGFSPDKLGASTTILVGFRIDTPNKEVPSPVTNVSLRLPAGVGLGESTLGFATCTAITLETQGLEGCSPNAFMGFGSALVEVPFGPEIVDEPVRLVIIMGPPANGHTTMLFYAEGVSPVAATLVFPGVLLPDAGPFGANLDTAIPLTPSVPGSADAAVVTMHSGLGPRSLIYNKHVHGKEVHYRPQGMAVPETCPRGGFPFSATFTFQDGTTTVSTSSVPCPTSRTTH